MKKLFLLSLVLAFTFVGQLLLGLVRSDGIFLEPLLVLPWILVPPLLKMDRKFYYLSFLVGLIWDLCFEPIIGPGIIAWSMTATLIWWSLSKLSGRGLGVWAGLGSASAMLVWVFRALSLRIVGLQAGTPGTEIVVSALMTGVFCLFIGFLYKMDIPSRIHRMRIRRLR